MESYLGCRVMLNYNYLGASWRCARKSSLGTVVYEKDLPKKRKRVSIAWDDCHCFRDYNGGCDSYPVSEGQDPVHFKIVEYNIFGGVNISSVFNKQEVPCSCPSQNFSWNGIGCVCGGK